MRVRATASYSIWRFAIWVCKAGLDERGTDAGCSSAVQPDCPICPSQTGTTGSYYMSFFKRLTFATAISAAAVITPIMAQTVADEAQPTASLNIPTGQLYGANNPNVRKATAEVNGEIITGTDIDHRIALLTQGNQAQIPSEQLPAFRTEVLTRLIDETLQIQEAAANDIEITDAELKQYFERIVQQNYKQTPQSADPFFAKMGSSSASLKRQVKGEIAWSRLLSRNVRPNANVSDDEVKAIQERLQSDRGQPEYRVGEICIRVDSPQEQAAATESARKIVEELRAGGNFAQIARRLSQCSTAARGGDLGWTKQSQVPASLQQAVFSMSPNEIVAVPTSSGISILLLIDKRQIGAADPGEAVLSLKQIAITFPKGSTEKQAEPLVARFAQQAQSIRGCGTADDMAKQMNAEVVNRDGIRVKDLPGPLQQVMSGLQIGQSTQPYGSLEDGVRVFVLCGRDMPQEVKEETFEEIMSRLEDERVEKRAATYLRDIRRDAIIEYN